MEFRFKYWIQHVILGLIPQVYFRFTLYFSKFVTEEDLISTVETLNNWALELARLGIAVFFCPIIVSQTIKCRDNEIDVIINSDQELMTDYFALLTELQDSSGDAISCSHGFRSKTELISASKALLQSLNSFVFPKQPQTPTYLIL